MGIVLFISAVIALILANTPWADTFHSLLELKLGFSIHFWINNGLMTLFFALIGMEIKREILQGDLSSVKKAAFPALGALGGMIVPALIYLAVNGGPAKGSGGAGQAGWGIPMATDIAFAMSLLALFGSKIPSNLRVFLTSLAIIDDLGAVLVIALFYTPTLSLSYLALSIAGVFGLVCLNRFAVRSAGLWVLSGVVLWACILQSGVHSTIAGVIFGLLAPADVFENPLHPWVNYAVMPLFALANSGIRLSADAVSAMFYHPVALGILCGLIIGKPIGILSACGVGELVGLAQRPHGASWIRIAGISALAGIGFTMSLFVSGLAFPGNADLSAISKMAIFLASICSAIAGTAVLIFVPVSGAATATKIQPKPVL